MLEKGTPGIEKVHDSDISISYAANYTAAKPILTQVKVNCLWTEKYFNTVLLINGLQSVLYARRSIFKSDNR